MDQCRLAFVRRSERVGPSGRSYRRVEATTLPGLVAMLRRCASSAPIMTRPRRIRLKLTEQIRKAFEVIGAKLSAVETLHHVLAVGVRELATRWVPFLVRVWHYEPPPADFKNTAKAREL